MAAFVSGNRTVQSEADGMIIDLAKGLKYLDPKEHGIALMRRLGINAPPVSNWKHYWTETNLATRKETVTLADGSGTSLDVADAYQYSTDDLLRIENEIVRITAIVDADTVTIVRAQAGTTGAAHSSKVAYWIGNAREENSTVGLAVSDGVDRLYNLVQTFDRPVSLSTHAMAMLQTESGNPLKGQMKRRFIEQIRNLAAATVYGIRYEDTSNKRYYMGGLKQFVTTNVTNLAGALTIDAVDDKIEQIVLAGGKVDVIGMHPTVKRKLDLLDEDQARRDFGDKTGGTTAFQKWRSGLLDYQLDVVVDHTFATDELWLLDTSTVHVGPMSNNGHGHGFRVMDATTPGQDGETKRMLGHYTMKVDTEKANGYIYGIT